MLALATLSPSYLIYLVREEIWCDLSCSTGLQKKSGGRIQIVLASFSRRSRQPCRPAGAREAFSNSSWECVCSLRRGGVEQVRAVSAGGKWPPEYLILSRERAWPFVSCMLCSLSHVTLGDADFQRPCCPAGKQVYLGTHVPEIFRYPWLDQQGPRGPGPLVGLIKGL
jgi:hypothetical protein